MYWNFPYADEVRDEDIERAANDLIGASDLYDAAGCDNCEHEQHTQDESETGFPCAKCLIDPLACPRLWARATNKAYDDRSLDGR